jgi:hypothetical protein
MQTRRVAVLGNPYAHAILEDRPLEAWQLEGRVGTDSRQPGPVDYRHLSRAHRHRT